MRSMKHYDSSLNLQFLQEPLWFVCDHIHTSVCDRNTEEHLAMAQTVEFMGILGSVMFQNLLHCSREVFAHSPSTWLDLTLITRTIFTCRKTYPIMLNWNLAALWWREGELTSLNQNSPETSLLCTTYIISGILRNQSGKEIHSLEKL